MTQSDVSQQTKRMHTNTILDLAPYFLIIEPVIINEKHMSASIRPLGENVLVKPEKAEKKTETGIYLPESASQEKPQQGKVLAVGESEKIMVKKGQRVIYTRYSGTEIKMDGEECLIVKSEDIIAVVE